MDDFIYADPSRVEPSPTGRRIGRSSARRTGFNSQRWRNIPPSCLCGEIQEAGVVELPQTFHRLKWRQLQAFAGEAGSSPWKFGTNKVDQIMYLQHDSGRLHTVREVETLD